MTPLFAGALSAGVSFISGLFGRNDAKKQQKKVAQAEAIAFDRSESEARRYRNEAITMENENRQAVERENRRALELGTHLGQQYLNQKDVDIGAFVGDAERAGFNPLTYLRAGGLSLYSKAHDLPGYQMQNPGQSVFQASALPGMPTFAPSISAVPSLATVAAGAAKDGFSAFMTEMRHKGNQDFQRTLLERTIQAQAALRKGRSVSMNVPSVSVSGSRVDKQSKPLFYGGAKLPKDPGTSDTQDFSDRYGEEGPMSWIIGPGVAYQDAKAGWKEKTFLQIMKDIDRWTAMPLAGVLPSFSTGSNKDRGPLYFSVTK